MIFLKNMTGAFLKRGNHYLLMKRAENRSLNPGLWSNVGGHIEQQELNDPYSACISEIYEETGIIRRASNIIRQSYIYFGETDVAEVQQTNEGALFWIPESELMNRKFSPTYTHMLAHFMDNHQKGIVVGTTENNERLQMNWSLIEDFD